MYDDIWNFRFFQNGGEVSTVNLVHNMSTDLTQQCGCFGQGYPQLHIKLDREISNKGKMDQVSSVGVQQVKRVFLKISLMKFFEILLNQAVLPRN